MSAVPGNGPDYDVIIVGGGPVGLTLANLLGGRELRVLLLEQQTELPDQPRAVSLDDESLRIWQQCGLIDAILPFVAQGEEGDRVFTYRSHDGKPIFSLRQQGRPYGYARGNVFLYHRVLEVLLAGLERFPLVDYRPGVEVTGFEHKQTAVLVGARDRMAREQYYSGAYLVGCDGGRSRVRTQLGIPLEGMAYQESWLIVDTFAPSSAARPLSEGVEVWCDARCPTATIPLPGGYRRWEFLLRNGAERYAEQNLSAAAVLELIARRKPVGDAAVVRSLVHTYKARVAGSYRCGNIFLAGDAAHLSPPFAGQGMATGLRDAANLAWKLAHVRRGRAAVALLDGYEQERRPHQIRMLRLARRMGRMMMPRTQLQAVLIRWFFAFAGKLPAIRRLMEIRGQNVTPVYAAGNAAGKAGQLLPQPRLADGTLMDELLGADYTLISFAVVPERALAAPERRAWEARGLAFLQLQPKGRTADAYRVFDDWLGGCARRVLIVRPDRFICEDHVVADGD